MMVVNCNAGMDRSGTINVLVQLVLETRHNLAHGMSPEQARAKGFAAIPTIVHNIKMARPRAISSVPRYLFLYRAYAAYWDPS
jgi:protein tyrosine phosphatase